MTAPLSPGVYRIELSTPPTSSTVKATGAALGRGRWEVSELREDDPNSGAWTHRALSSWKRGDWDCTVDATCELTSTEDEFQISEGLTASLAGEVRDDAVRRAPGIRLMAGHARRKQAAALGRGRCGVNRAAGEQYAQHR